MSRKFRGPKLVGPSGPKPETRDITDKSKLVWKSFFDPMSAAVANLNAAIQQAQNTVAQCIIEAEGLTVEEWVFDMDKLKLMKRPKAG